MGPGRVALHITIYLSKERGNRGDNACGDAIFMMLDGVPVTLSERSLML
jgi:hypothetical protein